MFKTKLEEEEKEMKNIKKIAATMFMTALMVGSSFAAPGLYVSDVAPQEPGDPCTVEETSFTDTVVDSFTGIIVHGFTGIIVHGVDGDSSDETCGIIVHG
jgi:hypothetical protein